MAAPVTVERSARPRSAAPEVVVAGGSIAGLSLALFLARRGCPVTVLEADEGARTGPFDEAQARSPRWATPQSHHSHAFLARGRDVLATEAPDVLAGMLDVGVHERDLVANRPAALPVLDDVPTEELVVLLSRRATFEAVLRHHVAGQDGVEVRRAEVAGLALDRTAATPRVTGVVLAGDEVVAADVVADCTGRRGDVTDWLEQAGIAVEATDDDCGIAYHTRFHRLRMGATWADLNRVYTAGASWDRYSCLVFPGDRDTFSVTFGTLPEDRDLHGLRREEGFAAAAAALPLIAPWVDADRSEPISPVRTMTRMRNRVRVLRDADGRPSVTGFVQVADAAAISNPAHSRGCSLALLHAQRLADAVVEHADPGDLAEAALAILDATLVPWVDDSRRQDRARLSRWRPDADITPPSDGQDRVTNGQAWVAGHHDPVVWYRFTRLQQLLDEPDEVLADPDVVDRVAATRRAGLALPRHEGPTHDDLAGLLDRATSRTSVRLAS